MINIGSRVNVFEKGKFITTITIARETKLFWISGLKEKWRKSDLRMIKKPWYRIEEQK